MDHVEKNILQRSSSSASTTEYDNLLARPASSLNSSSSSSSLSFSQTKNLFSSSPLTNSNHNNFQFSTKNDHFQQLRSVSSQQSISDHQTQQRRTHHRTRSVDLRLSNSCSSPSSQLNHADHLFISSIKDLNRFDFFSSLEERVAKLYYKHGLFCSRHPFLVILISLLVVFICSYPIFTFRKIFGSSSNVYFSSLSPLKQSIVNQQQIVSNQRLDSSFNNRFLENFDQLWKNSFSLPTINNDRQNVPPWFQPNQSFAYVQQIFIRSAVIPWTKEMQLVDALRGPLWLVFDLIEAISNYRFKDHLNREFSLNDLCFQVFEPILSARYAQITNHLPSYSCLMLSPASIWHGDSVRFKLDSSFLNTLLKFQDIHTSPLPSGAIHDLLFGVSFDETGIRKTYGRNRCRTITYAVTLILKDYIPDYIDGLRSFLIRRYPLSFSSKQNHKSSSESKNRSKSLNEHLQEKSDNDDDPLNQSTVKHVYFHKTFTYNYLVPLVMIYSVVCLYMYFSVRKMEIVRNKFLFTLCALITVLMSLFMSFGICFRLRFNSGLIVSRLLPYFVAGISFENMIVLTRTVLASPQLDSSVRVAQGLSKEGLLITKNLFTELTLLTIGSFAFPPFFQECCKIAAVCFITDFFIQIMFFTPFFSLHIQRIYEQNFQSKKYSKLSNSSLHSVSSYPKNIYAHPPGKAVLRQTPKRLRFIYFLARLRLIQRGFILVLCACLGLAIYNAFLMLEQTTTTTNLFDVQLMDKNVQSNLSHDSSTSQKFEEEAEDLSKNEQDPMNIGKKQKYLMKFLKNPVDSFSTVSSMSNEEVSNKSSASSTETDRISYNELNPLPRSMSNQHWANLFSMYNISLIGRYVSILNPITLSVVVQPDEAQRVRNPDDSDYRTLKKLIPMKFTNGEYVISDDEDIDSFDLNARKNFNFWKFSKDDIHIILGLWIPSLIFFIYLFVQLYRCVCTRNYAEWRSQISSTNFNPFRKMNSFVRNQSSFSNEKTFRIDLVFLPSVSGFENSVENLKNQLNLNQDQEIDLIASNVQNSLVAMSTMSGDVRVFDALTYESLANINRSQIFKFSFSVFKPFNFLNSGLNSFNSNRCFSILSSTPTISPVTMTPGNVLQSLFNGITLEESDIKSVDQEQDNELEFQPIWCMDLYDRYVLLGCGGPGGRFEVWDAHLGHLVFFHQSTSSEHLNESIDDSCDMSHAITSMKATYWGVALARFNGSIELFEVDQMKEEKYSTVLATSSRKLSTTKCNTLQYSVKHRFYAHQQPIFRIEIIDALEDEEFLKIFGSRGCLISGSLDTTLKVFSLSSCQLIYTLNGHCGAITALAIDPFSTASAVSGCQLGQLCIWDLNTGTCLFNMQAHPESEVLSITSSLLYHVSAGTDNRICIWDRYSGQLVNAINQQHNTCRTMIFLESYILVTVRDGDLVVWDVNDARPMCLLSLAMSASTKTTDQTNSTNDDQKQEPPISQPLEEEINNKWTKSYQIVSVKNLLFSYQRQAFICDFGSSLCVMNNPFATVKLD